MLPAIGVGIRFCASSSPIRRVLLRGPVLADQDDNAADATWLLAARRAHRNCIAARLLADAERPGHRSRCLQVLAADPGMAALLAAQ